MKSILLVFFSAVLINSIASILGRVIRQLVAQEVFITMVLNLGSH